MCVLLLCSVFERFRELHNVHRLASSTTQTDELSQLLTATGYINPEVCLPVEFIAETLPELKVRQKSYDFIMT